MSFAVLWKNPAVISSKPFANQHLRCSLLVSNNESPILKLSETVHATLTLDCPEIVSYTPEGEYFL